MKLTGIGQMLALFVEAAICFALLRWAGQGGHIFRLLIPGPLFVVAALTPIALLVHTPPRFTPVALIVVGLIHFGLCFLTILRAHEPSADGSILRVFLVQDALTYVYLAAVLLFISRTHDKIREEREA